MFTHSICVPYGSQFLIPVCLVMLIFAFILLVFIGIQAYGVTTFVLHNYIFVCVCLFGFLLSSYASNGFHALFDCDCFLCLLLFKMLAVSVSIVYTLTPPFRWFVFRTYYGACLFYYF